MCEDAMLECCCVYFVNKVTCFRNIGNPSCIDLILANKPRSFIQSSVIEMGLSDFHRVPITIMITTFQ